MYQDICELNNKTKWATPEDFVDVSSYFVSAPRVHSGAAC